MNSETLKTINELGNVKYKYGFVTELESEKPRKGLDENIIKFISEKKQEPKFLLC